MARIVQDSDEELDDDLERDLPPPKQPDAIGKPPSNNAATHGIGSAGRAVVHQSSPTSTLLNYSSRINQQTDRRSAQRPP